MLWQKLLGTAASSSAGGLAVTFVDRQDQTAGTTVTFASVNFGSAATDRRIYISVMASETTLRTTTCTVAGVSAYAFTKIRPGSQFTGQVFAVDLPTETSGSVVLNYSGPIGTPRVSIGVWSVLGQTSAIASALVSAIANFTVTGLYLSTVANSVNGGFALIHTLNNGSGQVVTYSGATLNSTFLATRTIATMYSTSEPTNSYLTTQSSASSIATTIHTFNP